MPWSVLFCSLSMQREQTIERNDKHVEMSLKCRIGKHFKLALRISFLVSVCLSLCVHTGRNRHRASKNNTDTVGHSCPWTQTSIEITGTPIFFLSLFSLSLSLSLSLSFFFW